MSKELELLVQISNNLKSQYEGESNPWEGSAFAWIKGGIASRTKGKVGELLVQNFLQSQGFSVSASAGTDSDLSVDGRKVEIKLSTLWNGGFYKFQQIRQQEYDILFCLGISPNDAYAWVVAKSDIQWDTMSHQHGGQRGTDTWWIRCEPANCPHDWLRPSDGDLSKICGELKRVMSRLNQTA